MRGCTAGARTQTDLKSMILRYQYLAQHKFMHNKQIVSVSYIRIQADFDKTVKVPLAVTLGCYVSTDFFFGKKRNEKSKER